MPDQRAAHTARAAFLTISQALTNASQQHGVAAVQLKWWGPGKDPHRNPEPARHRRAASRRPDTVPTPLVGVQRDHVHRVGRIGNSAGRRQLVDEQPRPPRRHPQAVAARDRPVGPARLGGPGRGLVAQRRHLRRDVRTLPAVNPHRGGIRHGGAAPSCDGAAVRRRRALRTGPHSTSPRRHRRGPTAAPGRDRGPYRPGCVGARQNHSKARRRRSSPRPGPRPRHEVRPRPARPFDHLRRSVGQQSQDPPRPHRHDRGGLGLAEASSIPMPDPTADP